MKASLLCAQGLDPWHGLVLVALPDNEKTSLAEAIARALALPLSVMTPWTRMP